jgi:glucosamine--fructose-6-phosphate aminotransferase (isomerizing)
MFKQVGKVAALRKHTSEAKVDMAKTFLSQTSMAHTRWATHGQPSSTNCHPHRSDPDNEFTVVHNGIITNYKELRVVLEKRGYHFESDTDTEIVAKLIKYLWDSSKGKNMNFTTLVKSVVKELVRALCLPAHQFDLTESCWKQEGAFAFVFKSVHFPDEIVVCRRGSPVLIGVKTEKKLKVDFVDVEFGTAAGTDELESRMSCLCLLLVHAS